MPLLQLHTNAVLADDRRNDLLALLSKTLAETIGKPEVPSSLDSIRTRSIE